MAGTRLRQRLVRAKLWRPRRLAMWISIIFMGRLIGFTTSRAAVVAPPPAGVNFDDFLQGTPNDSRRNATYASASQVNRHRLLQWCFMH